MWFLEFVQRVKMNFPLEWRTLKENFIQRNVWNEWFSAVHLNSSTSKLSMATMRKSQFVVSACIILLIQPNGLYTCTQRVNKIWFDFGKYLLRPSKGISICVNIERLFCSFNERKCAPCQKIRENFRKETFNANVFCWYADERQTGLCISGEKNAFRNLILNWKSLCPHICNKQIRTVKPIYKHFEMVYWKKIRSKPRWKHWLSSSTHAHFKYKQNDDFWL